MNQAPQADSAHAGPVEGRALSPSREAMSAFVLDQSGGEEQMGWAMRMDRSMGYDRPSVAYAVLVDQLVDERTDWLDLGCGRFLFPPFPKHSRVLADRAGKLVGVDPDPTIRENPYIHEHHEGFLDSFETTQRFDLVTLQMVAEHVTEPESLVREIAALLKPGGRVVVYTVHKWSPIAVITRLVPHGLHHPVKKVLWRTEEKDTFPVAMKMNTRGALREVFAGAGLEEESYEIWDDCSALGRWRATRWLELAFRRVLRAVGLRYPEGNILAVYRAPVTPAPTA